MRIESFFQHLRERARDAITCRSLAEPASRIIWSRLVDLEPLWKVLLDGKGDPAHRAHLVSIGVLFRGSMLILLLDSKHEVIQE